MAQNRIFMLKSFSTKKKVGETMEENKNAYSEVIEILKLIDDEKMLEALPMEMLEVLKLKVNPEYKPQISKEIPLEEQNLQPETFSILSWIAMKYWGEEITKTEFENSNSALPIASEDLKWYQKIRAKIIEIFHKIFRKKQAKQEVKDKEEGSIL